VENGLHRVGVNRRPFAMILAASILSLSACYGSLPKLCQEGKDML